MADFTGKTLGVVGLGLIGGSFVKSYVQAEDWRILGYDKDNKVNQFVLLAEDIDDILTDENVDQCDLILLAVYPHNVLLDVLDGQIRIHVPSTYKGGANSTWRREIDYYYRPVVDK